MWAFFISAIWLRCARASSPRRDSAVQVDMQVGHALPVGLAVIDTDVVAVGLVMVIEDVLGRATGQLRATVGFTASWA